MNMSEWLCAYLNQLDRHPKLKETFHACFLSTIKTTTKTLSDQTTFIFTGDIPAMWLRDSSVQVSHYVRFAKDDIEIKNFIRELIRRQFLYILDDPYANAFLENKDMISEHHDDITTMRPGVWERKYEIDSLCYPLWLLEQYLDVTDDRSMLDDLFTDACQTIVDLWITEQHHEHSPYTFDRLSPYAPWDTLSNQGKGSLVGYTGMSWSGFRPSDDACTYHYNIPANLFIVRTLRFLIHVYGTHQFDHDLLQKMMTLKQEIEEGIARYGWIDHPSYGKIYAYEVDGLGNYLLMDDPNVPSLLSLPYLDIIDKQDVIYQNTRKFILSPENPYYVIGKYAKGISSQHTPKGYIWPMALAIQGLTADTLEEAFSMIEMLLAIDDHTHQMHESVDVDDPSKYTRPWFAWANTLFAVLVMSLDDHELGKLIDYLNQGKPHP